MDEPQYAISFSISNTIEAWLFKTALIQTTRKRSVTMNEVTISSSIVHYQIPFLVSNNEFETDKL
mgnify:FL=1